MAIIERNRVAMVVKDGKIIQVLSSHPILFDVIDLDKEDDAELLSEFENLDALTELLPYQTQL